MEEAKELAPAGGPGMKAQKRRITLRNVGIAVAGILVIVALGAIAYGLATHPVATAAIRDISIIVLALLTIVIAISLVVLILQLQSLIALVRDEVKPILDSATQTASTVRGTTTFLSDAVVTPMITVASYAYAIRQTVRVLAGSKRRKKSRSPSPEGETEAG